MAFVDRQIELLVYALVEDCQGYSEDSEKGDELMLSPEKDSAEQPMRLQERATFEQVVAKDFLRDIKDHHFALVSDDGPYRHLVFRISQPTPGSSWFEIITWPNCLTINGDMGTWSFSHLKDMFAFFRSTSGRINPSYWCEKITSESRFGGPSMVFKAEVFRENVLYQLDQHSDLSLSRKVDIVNALQDEVFCAENEANAYKALADFKAEDFSFADSWEIGGRGYSYHYLWCLHAIVWAIQQYDIAMGTLGTTNTKPNEAEPHAGGKS